MSVIETRQKAQEELKAIEEVTAVLLPEPSTALVPFVVSFVATVLSALYPALQAARLQIVDALRVE